LVSFLAFAGRKGGVPRKSLGKDPGFCNWCGTNRKCQFAANRKKVLLPVRRKNSKKATVSMDSECEEKKHKGGKGEGRRQDRTLNQSPGIECVAKQKRIKDSSKGERFLRGRTAEERP